MSFQQEASYKYACSECTRRKQKCNRDWPCENCIKRNVPMLCKYNSIPPSKLEDTTAEKGHRRSSLIAVHDTEKLLACGLGPSYLQQLGHKIEPVHRIHLLPLGSPQPWSALIPTISRKDADVLLRVFINKVHIHCDIVHLTSFVKQYSDWWAARLTGGTVNLHWTCLLLEVFACATQQEYPSEKGTPGKRFHDAAESLHRAMYDKAATLFGLQRMAYACFWNKCEGHLSSCRAALSSAWLMAVDLGVHQEPASPEKDIEIEMKRKIWLYITEWDLEIAILLSQPKVIDQTCCSVRLPDARQNLTLRRVMARVGLFKFIFECRDHNRPRLEDGIRTWQEGLPPDLEYSPEAMRSDVPEGKFYRIYAHVVKIIAHISPLIPRPGISIMDPAETSAVISHCLLLAESLQNLVEMLRAQEIRMLFFSYYIFTCIAVLCRAHNSATDSHFMELANEKVRWAYNYLLDSEASSNLAMALTPVLPESFKSSQGRSGSVEEAGVESSTGTAESSSGSRATSMASTTPGVHSESFFDTLRSEQLDALADKWRQGALEPGEDL